MSSFLEKLKKGMGTEIEEKELEEPKEKNEELDEKLIIESLESKKPAKKAAKKIKTKLEKETKSKTKKEDKNFPVKTKKELEEELKKSKIAEYKEKWFESEGQLAVDVYKTDSELVIQSAIAGIKPEDLDISIEEDSVLIRGNREKPPEKDERNYFYQECYWGPFSRQIILSEEIDSGRAEAKIKEGILTIRIPIVNKTRKRKLVVKE